MMYVCIALGDYWTAFESFISAVQKYYIAWGRTQVTTMPTKLGFQPLILFTSSRLIEGFTEGSERFAQVLLFTFLWILLIKLIQLPYNQIKQMHFMALQQIQSVFEFPGNKAFGAVNTEKSWPNQKLIFSLSANCTSNKLAI